MVQQDGRDDRSDHLLDDLLLHLLRGDSGIVLGTDHHCVDPLEFAQGILQRHLGFTIGPQVREGRLFPHFGKASGQLVGEGDGQGHEVGILYLAVDLLPTGVAHHHPLVPGPNVGGVHQPHGLGDFGGLSLDCHRDSAGLIADAVFGLGVPSVAQNLAHQICDVRISSGGDLPHHHH